MKKFEGLSQEQRSEKIKELKAKYGSARIKFRTEDDGTLLMWFPNISSPWKG